METFGARLHAAMAARGPLCVGIDPHAELLQQWGLPDTVDGVAEFSRTVVDALADRVAVFKPQSAFFERFGSSGIAILESTIRQLRAAGALVLLDVKRGDIGSTMAAYADCVPRSGEPDVRRRDHREPVPGVRFVTPRNRPGGRAWRPACSCWR